MSVYRPGRDSYLLASVIEEKNLEGLNCLEIGTGSGFLAEKMLEQGAQKVVAVDINPEAVEEASRRLSEYDNAEIFSSDMFDEVSGVFDIILFNPPYLPDEESEIGDEEIWAGGEKGVEVTEKFVSQASDYLTENGEAFFVASSLADIESFGDFEVVSSEKLWFEELYVMKFE
ncbi:HemK2/MTQ2 family protein methyltransferase [Candidatus Nanosalina sp. VS9-1]|uniref:HemK2/MTQ2 family protein methyltransferase n=1 Tax=Candidatus Nanosalina sp. VS9-1 TaxID=3388566 RepID=UPI0039E1D519